MRQFDNPMTQEAYELYMRMSVEQLAVVIIRLREYMGDFVTQDGDC